MTHEEEVLAGRDLFQSVAAEHDAMTDAERMRKLDDIAYELRRRMSTEEDQIWLCLFASDLLYVESLKAASVRFGRVLDLQEWQELVSPAPEGDA